MRRDVADYRSPPWGCHKIEKARMWPGRNYVLLLSSHGLMRTLEQAHDSCQIQIFTAVYLFLPLRQNQLLPKPAPEAASHPIQLARSQNPEGETMSSLDNALRELRQRRSGMQVELEKLDQIISGIESLNGAGTRNPNHHGTRTMSAAVTKAPAKRTMSAAARRKISLAQKKRWAKQNGQAPKATRKMSAAGRKRIAAASRARWAAFRAAKKAA